MAADKHKPKTREAGWGQHRSGDFDVPQGWARRHVALLVLVVVMALAGVIAIALSRAETLPPDTEAEQLIVKYKPGADVQAIEKKVDAIDGAEIVDDSQELRMKFVETEEGADTGKLKEQLEKDANVEYVEKDPVLKPLAVPSDPFYGQQVLWPRVQAETVWDRTQGSVTVAVVDSGINAAHPELAGKTVPGYNFPADNTDVSDTYGHGTEVSAVLAANTNNGSGMAGGCWGCKIMPLKVTDAGGSAKGSMTAKAFQYAADHGVRIINNSMGGYDFSQALADAVTYARSKGALVIASGGNEASGDLLYPASYPGALGVAGTAKGDDKLWPDSNTGNHLQIAAPGTGIIIPDFEDNGGTKFLSASGTSYSSPAVAAVAALLLSAFPGTTVDKLQTALTSTADTCCDGKIGGGRVNATKAYDYLAGGATTPPTPPPTPPVTPPTTPPPTPPTGSKSPDINADGKVNLSDLSIMLSKWKTTDTKSDLNTSGSVELGDLSILLSKWKP